MDPNDFIQKTLGYNELRNLKLHSYTFNTVGNNALTFSPSGCDGYYPDAHHTALQIKETRRSQARQGVDKQKCNLHGA